jgi:putative ABC transport system permease protein
MTVTSVMRDRTSGLRDSVVLLLSAALAALFLAALGIYAQVHGSVRARTREIGIRIAVGAHPARIVRLMLTDSFVTLSLGLLLGGLSAEWLRLIVLPSDSEAVTTTWVTWAVAVVVVVVAFVMSVLGPTRRAVTIDPAASLRGDLA